MLIVNQLPRSGIALWRVYTLPSLANSGDWKIYNRRPSVRHHTRNHTAPSVLVTVRRPAWRANSVS